MPPVLNPDLSRSTSRSERLHVGILAALACAILFVDAGAKELHGTAAFYASLIREVLESGSPLGIYTDERAYLLKPPLLVWLGALSSKVFGLTNFGVTFISRIAGVGAIMATYFFVRRWWGHPIAWLAALAMLTNSTFVQFTATLRMDSLLMLGMMLSIVGWTYRDARWSAAAIFGGITLGVLSKGPLGLAPIPLILCHAWMLGISPIPRGAWRWAALLFPVAAWYASLVAVHGVQPFSELGADALRATAAPEFNHWQSAAFEYVVKPVRRYWPWLPFMLAGAVMALRRILQNNVREDMRKHYAWVVSWCVVVFASAALKPDHDIRYLYPALPVLGLFAAMAIDVLTQGRLPAPAPAAILAIVLLVLFWPGDPSWRAPDNRDVAAAIRDEVAPYADILAIGGYPVRLDQPRRQNTHRDWIHFYTGKSPRVLSWEQAQEEPRAAFRNGVFLTRSRGHQARLREFGLRAKYQTKEMIFAVPE